MNSSIGSNQNRHRDPSPHSMAGKLCLLLCTACAIAACTTAPQVIPSQQSYTGTGSQTVFVVNHGWHTGFAVPSAAVRAHIPQLTERFNNTPYMEFGWGDKGFYQAQEITTGITLQAIFLPTDSVIHAVSVPDENIARYFSGSSIATLPVSAHELEQLSRFIAGSFARTTDASIIPLKKGIYGNSQFYKGTGSYHLMNTCNKWTAKGLQSMGMDISPTFKLTASSIMRYLARQKKATDTATKYRTTRRRSSCLHAYQPKCNL